MLLFQLSINAAQVLASTSDGEDGGFAYIFLAAGFIFYGVMYLRYRNTDKRHHHESETLTEKVDLQQKDELVGRKKGLKRSSIEGQNHRAVRGASNKKSWPFI